MADRIRIKCANCGKTLAVPASAAGRKTKCPACGNVNRVPAAGDGGSGEFGQKTSSGPSLSDISSFAANVPELKPSSGRPAEPRPPKKKKPKRKKQESSYDDFGDDPLYDDFGPADDAGATDQFADDLFGGVSVPDDPYSGGAMPPKRKKKKKSSKPRIKSSYNAYEAPSAESRSGRRSHEDEELTGADIVLCLLCSNLGCLIGIIRLCTGKTANGRKMIMLSFAVPAVLIVLGLIGQALEAIGG